MPLWTGCGMAGLAARRISVVTCDTDVAAPLRLACVGQQTERAGAAAASLLSRMAPGDPSRGLITLSGRAFGGEDARRTGFARTGY